MEPFALKDKDTFPAPEVLRVTLKDSYAVFQQLEENLEDTGITVQWNYYKDGKAWMGKLLLKKKNLGWVQIYDGYFTTTCFFMEKHLDAIHLSDINKEIITDFESKIHTSGKLIPMTITLQDESRLREALTVISFKRKLK